MSRVFVRRRPADVQKYIRIRRVETLDDAGISDTSSDELNSSQDQENSRCLFNTSRYRGNPKALQLTPTNKFQPLSVTLSGKTVSPTQLNTSLNASSLSKSIAGTPTASCRTAWHSLRKTLTTLKRERRCVLEDTFIECSSATSIEANLRSLVDKQQMPSSAKVNALARKKQRCVKGGYLQEYKRLMQKERMDRRSLSHNQRLGIRPGHRVLVLGIFESFGSYMARVQTVDPDEPIFNVIVAPSMATNITVGSSLELYFDLKADSALQLPNKELVFIQPNKLVLL
ncbi:hypothetical protein ACLKA6_005927 [Drosophila palustris]